MDRPTLLVNNAQIQTRLRLRTGRVRPRFFLALVRTAQHTEHGRTIKS